MTAAPTPISGTPATDGVGRKRAVLPRLGFLGVGWIGRHRMEAVARSGAADIVAVGDTSPEMAAKAAEVAPGAAVVGSLEDLLGVGISGVAIATPSALHADQASAALGRGVAVFCQKPLGRNAAETRRVVAEARANDLLLAVDLSYRFVDEIRAIRQLCQSGELGDLYAVDLTFHNAYGPDKPWFYDWRQSGGGCVMDLGIHLVDLALWSLGFPEVQEVSSRLFAQGKRLTGRTNTVEDYAVAQLDLANGATVRLACSWKLQAGCDAIIQGAFYGTRGGAAFHNVDGSFYRFAAERFHGTKRETLVCSPGEWGGRAAADWAKRLANGARFDPEVEQVNQVAEVLDAIYA